MELEEARRLKEQANETRKRLEQKLKIASAPFKRDEFKLILGMLHPDKHIGSEDRAKRAFETFKRIQPFCDDSPVLRAVK